MRCRPLEREPRANCEVVACESPHELRIHQNPAGSMAQLHSHWHCFAMLSNGLLFVSAKKRHVNPCSGVGTDGECGVHSVAWSQRLTATMVELAVANGHLHTVKHIMETDGTEYAPGRTEDCGGGVSTRAMQSAAGNGHTELVKYLHEEGLGECTRWLMHLAASSGHEETAIYIESHFPGPTSKRRKL